MKPALMFTAHMVVIATLAATAAAATKHLATAPALPSEADWRSPDPVNVLVIDTTKGRMIVELAPQVAPKSAVQVRILRRPGLFPGD